MVSYRLMEALVGAGVNARMLVAEKLSDNPRVALAASQPVLKYEFLKERLGIFLRNGLDRETLFKIDNGAAGCDLASHPWVREADVVCLNWINQGLLSIKGVRKIAAMGKPVVWTMHDMWNMTGICHHAGDCGGWKHHCGNCPLLRKRASARDMSASTWERKDRLYASVPIHFVAVSNWLADKARESGLMHDSMLRVIPNPFPIEAEGSLDPGWRNDMLTMAFGAARLDDPIKGLPVLKSAMRTLRNDYPELARRCRLLTFGGLKNPAALEGMEISHEHLGMLSSDKVREMYGESDIIISTSLYETLPGTLVEGMAWGCVPVSLDRGGQRDIVDHLSTGYLAGWPEGDDIAEAGRRIAAGVVWAAEMLEQDGAAMRGRMYDSIKSRFSAEAVAASYKSMFAELV